MPKLTCKPLLPAALAALIPCLAASQSLSKLKRVLVYSGNQWAHESIPDVDNFVKRLGVEKGFQVDLSPATGFTASNLANYQVVVLNNNVGLGGTLNTSQRDALQAWFEAGGGLMGFHSNMDHRSQWPWYNDVAGTIFVGHSNIEAAVVHVPPEATAHPVGGWITAGFGTSLTQGGKTYEHASREFDEWYNYQNTLVAVPGATVLLKTVHSSYGCQCTMDAENHQAAWIRVYKGGRQFNSTFGGETERNKASFFADPVKEMLWRALMWTAGETPSSIAAKPAKRGPGAADLFAWTAGEGRWRDLTGKAHAPASELQLGVYHGALRLTAR